MKSRTYWFAFVGLALLSFGCSTSDDHVSFTGTWKNVKENGISDQKTEATVSVKVSNNRFRIESRDQDSELIQTYDGKTFNQKTTDLPLPGSTETPAPPAVTSDQKMDIQVENLRFWKGNYGGTGIPGGQIAGRETLLYQVQENRPDSKLTGQAWVDAENKVVLKKVFTIYSSQVEQMVSKTTDECQEIHYGPVDDSAFTKP